jgi:acetyl-CoA C-acetyltransferase
MQATLERYIQGNPTEKFRICWSKYPLSSLTGHKGAMKDDLIPVIVGVGQVTEKDVDPAEARSPVELMTDAVWNAMEDAGIHRNKLSLLDILVVVKGIIGTLPGVGAPGGAVRNPPKALAEAIGADKAGQYISATGGCTPQTLVAYAGKQIAKGNLRFSLFSGVEALDTMNSASTSGTHLRWDSASDSDPQMLFPDPDASTVMERAHGLFLPSHVYPLFDNALRKHYGRTIDEHQALLGKLLSPFTKVAATNPYAWFPFVRKPEEISTASSGNRYVGFPYTKLMNAMIKVNQSAAIIVTSAGFAREMGVKESRWVYLHGFAEALDHWYISNRKNYHSAPAIAKIKESALAMAGITLDDIDFFDLYSCFPSAIQITRDMLGIAENDPRPLTVTGGLPYFGGPGNNYVMHSLAAMVEKVRQYHGKKGLVTGNTWYLSKHNIGIFSTEPSRYPWHCQDSASDQAEIHAEPHPEMVNHPSGQGTIETYTVLYGRDGAPQKGIIIGRLEDNRRFIANAPQDPLLLENMTVFDPIGKTGRIRRTDKLNIFFPD